MNINENKKKSDYITKAIKNLISDKLSDECRLLCIENNADQDYIYINMAIYNKKEHQTIITNITMNDKLEIVKELNEKHLDVYDTTELSDKAIESKCCIDTVALLTQAVVYERRRNISKNLDRFIIVMSILASIVVTLIIASSM